MKSPFTYYGGKMGMAHRIVALMPSHRVYIEPFFGSGAVFFAKHPAVHEIVNDLDGAVVAFFRCLRDCPDELDRVCGLTPYARDEFMAAEMDDDLEDLERARRFWVRVNQSFAKTAGRRTGWSVTTARTQSTAASVRGRLARFDECADRLVGTSIEHCDAIGLIERLATADTVIYADPTYVRASRAAKGDDYRHEMTDADHERLAKVLHATPAAVILSGYPSDLYEDLYGDWNRLDTLVTVHSSNATTTARAARTEVLWTNYDPTEGRLAL